MSNTSATGISQSNIGLQLTCNSWAALAVAGARSRTLNILNEFPEDEDMEINFVSFTSLLLLLPCRIQMIPNTIEFPVLF